MDNDNARCKDVDSYDKLLRKLTLRSERTIERSRALMNDPEWGRRISNDTMIDVRTALSTLTTMRNFLTMERKAAAAAAVQQQQKPTFIWEVR